MERNLYAAIMSLASARIVAAVLAATAFVVSVTDKIVLQPVLWRVEPRSVGVPLGLLTVLLVGAGPMLVYPALIWPLRRRPASFEVHTDGPAFVIPASPFYSGQQAILLTFVAGHQVPVERVPYTVQVRLSTVSGIVPVSVAIMLVLTVVAVMHLSLLRPSVRLTPIGVAVRSPLRSQEISWQELLPGGPLVPGRRAWSMPLMYWRSGKRAKRLDVRLGYLHVDRVFLATAIRHYVEHPEDRGNIGTQAELERLESALASWPSSGQPVRTADPS